MLAALMRASTLVAVGIHHRDLLSGGNDLSAGGNCLTVTNCSTTCEGKNEEATADFFKFPTPIMTGTYLDDMPQPLLGHRPEPVNEQLVVRVG